MVTMDISVIGAATVTRPKQVRALTNQPALVLFFQKSSRILCCIGYQCVVVLLTKVLGLANRANDLLEGTDLGG